jgi:hypothetical protein
MKFRWNRTMLNLCGIVAAILKMATGRNCSMSGINLGHHNLPTYEISLKSDINEFVRHCGSHFENVGTSLSTHISNFDDIGQCWIFAAILKMATATNLSMSGINSGHHNLPTYEMSLKLDNVEFVRYCVGHFENGDR